MKGKVVISASASMPEVIDNWKDYWANHQYEVIYPFLFSEGDYALQWASEFSRFCKELSTADIHFIANEDSKRVEGYIGVGVFTELSHRVCMNMTSQQKAEIILLKEPSKDSLFHKDIMRWIDLGYVKIFQNISNE